MSDGTRPDSPEVRRTSCRDVADCGALRVAVLSASLSLLACVADATAHAEPKPPIEIQSELVAVTVTIDPAIEAHPALAAHILAEAKASAAESLAQAESAAGGTTKPSDFGPQWEFATSYELLLVVPDRYASVVVSWYGYTGGAHGSSGNHGLLWDLRRQRRARGDELFTETVVDGPTMKALTRLVLTAVILEKMNWGTLEPWGELLGPPSLEELVAADVFLRGFRISLDAGLEPSDQPGKSSGLSFYFVQCDIESCSAGPVTVFVPWRQLAPYLSTEGRAVFGGERPPQAEPAE